MWLLLVGIAIGWLLRDRRKLKKKVKKLRGAQPEKPTERPRPIESNPDRSIM